LCALARIRCTELPVVESDDVVVGILAQADVALNVTEKRAGETLEEISKPSTAPAWQ
jgi:CBS-domain-containing membrane protein